MDDMFSFVEETAWLNRDPKETIWDCVKKEFKETMAACGKKTIDRLKLVDETSKPAVYDGPIQIRVWESGGSPLERVDEKSSGDVKFHLKHKWRSRVLQTLSGWEFCLLPAKFDLRDWPKEESKPHQKKSHQIETFEVLSSLEPSRRSDNEQLGVSDNFPFAIVRTHISQSQSDLKCVTGNAHRRFDVMPLETKPLKNRWKKALQKTWWFKFKTSLERSKLIDDKLSFMEELGAQQAFNIEVWSGFDVEACIGFITYGWECKKQINIGHVSLNGMCNELVYDEEKKKLRNVKPAGCLCDLDQVNSLDEEEFVGFTELSKLQLAMEFLLLNSGIFMNTRLLHDKINSVFVTLRVALALLVVSEHNKAIRTRYEKAEKVDKHKINFTGKFAESIIVAVIDEHEDIETACVLLQMTLNGGTQTLSHLVKDYDDRRRITWFKLTLNSVSQQTTGSAPQSNEVQGETNWNDVTQTEAIWGAKHTSLGYVENSLAEFCAYEVYHPPRPPELSRYKEDEESTAIGSISAIVG